MTADVVSKAVTLIVTVAAARVLSSADFGVLALAMTTGWLLSVASDAGLPLFLAKHIAQRVAGDEPVPLAAVLKVLHVRVVFGVVAAAVGIIIAVVVLPGAAVAAFVVIIVGQLLNAVLETLSHAYRGLGRSEIESWLVLAQKGVTAVAALAVLGLHPSLWWLALTLAIPPAIALLASRQIAGRLFAREPTERRTPYSTFGLTRGQFGHDVAPIGVGILLSALYFRCDVFFVERWHGLEVVGLYNGAFRIVEALRLFPAAVLAIAFPMLCGATDLRPLRRLTAGLAAGGAVLFVVLYAVAPTVLEIVYGARFVVAAPALRTLALALPLFFVNYALTHQVIAWDGPRSYLAISATALVVNVTLNSLLIPTGGMTGAAVSTVVTEFVVAGGCVIALRRTARGPASAGSVSVMAPLKVR